VGSAPNAVQFLVARELRSRWRGLLVLALLTGIVGAVVLAATAGARRTQSAYPRLLDAIDAADADIEVSPEYFDAIAALPQVEAVAPSSYMFVAPAGGPEDVLTIAAVDDRFGSEVDRPHILHGRRSAYEQAGEVVVNTEYADATGVDVGDQIPLVSFTPEQMTQLIEGEDPGTPAGPPVEVTVVGIARTEVELVEHTPLIVFTPAFYERYRDEVGHFDDILRVKLTDDDAALDEFEREVTRIVPESDGALITTPGETAVQVEDANRVLAVSLAIFAVVAAIAGIVAIGQAFARHIELGADDQRLLRALGLTRGQRFVALLVPTAASAFAGAALAIVVAACASPLFPAGFARRIEPDPGLAFDWVVLGAGVAALFVLVLAAAALAAWRTSGRRAQASGAGVSARVMAALTRADLSPPTVIGLRMAVEPGRGARAVPVRAALAAAVVGVIGVVAALTFGAALGWLVTEPVAYGVQWDANFVGPFDASALDDEAAALAEDDAVAAAAPLAVVPIRVEGDVLQSYWFADQMSDLVTVIDGRAPRTASEVMVGDATLARLDRDLGDTVTAAGVEGSDPRELTIVGQGVFPEFEHPAVEDSDTRDYNDFAVLADAGDDALVADAGGEYFSMILVRWGPGVDGAAATARLEQEGATIYQIDEPVRFVNLGRVRAFPSLVAAFIVLLAVVVTSHALATSIRRRARDFTILKALGFVGAQIRGTVAWQATTLAVVGIVVGVPLGVLVGRAIWLVVARNLGIEQYVPIPWLAIAVTALAAVALANVLALFPARRAARLRPAVALAAE
jgi:putative ABC transport system permease protein